MSRTLPRLSLLVVGVAVLSFALLSGAADPAAADVAPMAAEPETNGESPVFYVGTPCEADWAKLCSDTEGTRTSWECLRRYYKKDLLSEECAAHTETVKQAKRTRTMARQRAWQDACAADVEQHCSQFAGNLNATKGCLYRVRDEVAPDCDEKLPRRSPHEGPGYFGWKDGSEPENFDEERRKRLRPKRTQEKVDAAASEEQEAARQKRRDEIRAQIEAARRERGEADPEAAPASESGEPAEGAESTEPAEPAVGESAAE